MDQNVTRVTIVIIVSEFEMCIPMLIIKPCKDRDRFVFENKSGDKRMNKLNQLKNRRLGFLAILILGLVAIPVFAQLLSNEYSRTVTVHSLNESFSITATAEFTVDTWVSEPITAMIYIEKIRPTSGYFYFRINNTDNLTIDTTMFSLQISYRKADSSTYSGFMPVTLDQFGDSAVQFKESVWFFETETESYYSLELTFNNNAIGGDYELQVFIDGS